MPDRVRSVGRIKLVRCIMNVEFTRKSQGQVDGVYYLALIHAILLWQFILDALK